MAISRAIADFGGSSLSFSQAGEVMLATRPQARNLPVLEWLIRNDLLIEDVPTASGSFDAENVVRPAFERLGDFLVAKELLERCETTSLEVASKEGGALHSLLRDSEAVERNSAVLTALSILIPEQHPGLELPDMVDDESIRRSLVEITIRSFSSRNPETFTDSSGYLIREALRWEALSFDAMDAVLSSSWQPSALDGIWLDELLKQKSLACARRLLVWLSSMIGSSDLERYAVLSKPRLSFRWPNLSRVLRSVGLRSFSGSLPQPIDG